MNSKLTHFNPSGDAHMVDVGKKSTTHRIAIADGWIDMQPETLKLIKSGESKKGDVLGIARIAGIMAAKKTGELIPLCHPITLTHVEVRFNIDTVNHCIHCEAQTETRGQTGVEMEALTSVQVSLLTIYDMCKAVDRGMNMRDIQLVKKTGGKSGNWTRKN